MKKILCITDAFTLGGAERQLIGLASFLKEEEYEVDLACYYKENFYKDLIASCGLNYIELHPKGRLDKIIQIRNLIKNNKYDCVIAYKDGPTLITSILKVLRMKPKLIVSERNTSQRLTIHSKIKFELYRFADYIVPNSFSQEKFIINNFPNLVGKLHTITNFTDVDFFSFNKKSKNTNLDILIAGRIAQQKNILRFLDAVNIIKENKLPFHFKWIGNVSTGEQEYEALVYDKLHSLQLEDIIEFHPATNSIRDEYQSCDAFCLPSLYEGYPNVICEAMSCGCPILCSRVCDNPFIVEDESNGFLFDPLDVQSIVRAFHKFLSLKMEERMDMSERNRCISVERFSKKNFVQKYIDLIES